ncbi:MAG: hypothetical protein JWO98_1169 [Frankiales bacterium]|nr:hypothetical protein [Frankiales bacterium]
MGETLPWTGRSAETLTADIGPFITRETTLVPVGARGVGGQSRTWIRFPAPPACGAGPSCTMDHGPIGLRIDAPLGRGPGHSGAVGGDRFPPERLEVRRR